ncbi:MAG TPA: translation initiation factor IF-2 [Patescibacteria group bacterium]|nr:translation initiation factor IF-2 [Patescibacteria group bacterium]
MNITELARKLKVETDELRGKLPELGFDIGQKAIKVDDQLATKIIRAWRNFEDREKQKQEYLKISQKEEKDEEDSKEKKQVEIPSVLTVKDFSEILKLPVTEVISELMKNGIMASMNQRIDFDTAAIVAEDLGFDSEEVNLEKEVELDKAKKVAEKIAGQEETEYRAPVVVVMGHVDHGKTKLLDAIRKTDIVSGEAGGITQHIGAYQVSKKGKKLTFIDTPGHEAFTAMRSRGAKVADIAILVVAATEGVKPQTIEGLKIAKEAGVPIIVAVNKIDLPEANEDKVKQELANHNLLPEEWGGKVPFVPISAKFEKNIDKLLDQLALTTEIMEDKLQANPQGDFYGSIIESHVDKGAGPIATVLVRNGTLQKGDCLVVDGIFYGKVKVLRDYKGREIEKAGPSQPAEIMGLKIAPKVGDILEVVANPKEAKRTKSYKIKKEESFIKKECEENEEDNQEQNLNLILRTDVLGSQEAIVESLKKIETKDVKIKFVDKSLGSVGESDVLNAEATGSIIYGFNVHLSSNVEDLAKEKDVEIKLYSIIYELIDDAKERIRKLRKAEIVRKDMGKVQVLASFKKGDDLQVIGGKVLKGSVEPGAKVAVLRGDEFITSGQVETLQVGKQEVKDCVKDQECGIKFKGQPLIEKDDVLDVYQEKKVYQ